MDEVDAEKLAVKRIDETTWSSNPETLPVGEELILKTGLEAKVTYKKNKGDSTQEELRQMLDANLKSNLDFKSAAKYMYIFGPKMYLKLQPSHMENSAPRIARLCGR